MKQNRDNDGKVINWLSKNLGAPAIDTIETLANWFGLGNWVKKITGDDFSAADFRRFIKEATVKAKSATNSKYQMFVDKLTALSLHTGSPTVKGFIDDTLKQLQEKKKTIDQKLDLAANFENLAENKVTEVEMMGTGERNIGKGLEARQEAQNLEKQAQDIYKGVEQEL